MKQDKDDPVISPVSIALKPFLTDEHKLQRVLYCAENVDPENRLYKSFYNHVHIDEKWFFVCKKDLHAYLGIDEDLSHRMTQNTTQMIRAMFLCAVARPRYNADGECPFDGKIGMWPFVERLPARRTSVNRERGTIEPRLVSCTRARYRQMLINNALPAIKARWPNQHNRDEHIILQQDGAAAHLDSGDFEFRLHANEGRRWRIELLTQSPKSPDVNVFDLSFFRALQSLQWQLGVGNTLNGLIGQVLNAFFEFETRKFDFGFITLH